MKWIRRIAPHETKDTTPGKIYPVLEEDEDHWWVTNDEGRKRICTKVLTNTWEEVSSSTNKEGEP